MALREQIGRTHREEKARVEREHIAESASGNRDCRADNGADERCERIGAQPAQRLTTVVALEKHEADRVHAVGEVVADDGDEDEQTGGRADVKGEADAEAVDQAVDG